MGNVESYKFLYKPIFFILSLLAATYLVVLIEKLQPSDLGALGEMFYKDPVIKRHPPYPLREVINYLNEDEIQHAEVAWNYFKNNYQPVSGLVNGFDAVPFCSVDDLGDYGMAIISAYEIGIIDSTEFDSKLQSLIDGISKLQLFEGRLPGKRYHSYTGALQKHGMGTFMDGWSALEIARFYRFVIKTSYTFPQYSKRLSSALKNWKLHDMIFNGEVFGWVYNSNKKIYELSQEGRMGTEEYAVKSLIMAGHDLSSAINYTDFLKFKNFGKIQLPFDLREYKNKFNPNYIISDPFIMDGIEYGWDLNSKEISYRIYKIQKDRYYETGIITSIGEMILPEKPFRFYYSIYADNKDWVCLNEKGEINNELKLMTVKSAFGWYALYNDPYSIILYEQAKVLYDPERGWFTGIGEQGKINKIISADVNSAILEVLNYIKNGRIIRWG